MTLTLKDTIWTGVTIVGLIVGGVVGFFSGREGLIQELRETNERLTRIEVRLDATALAVIGAQGFGPVPADTVSSGR